MSRRVATKSKSDPVVVEVPEVAAAFGMTTYAIYRHIKRGNLVAHRLGRRLLIPREAVEKFGKSAR